MEGQTLSAALELSVVLPCLNEVETLPGCLDRVRAALRTGGLTGEIIVADNGSTRQGELCLPVHPCPSRLALDEGHDVIEEPGGLAGVVQAQNVRVLELRSNLNFAEKSVGAQ